MINEGPLALQKGSAVAEIRPTRKLLTTPITRLPKARLCEKLVQKTGFGVSQQGFEPLETTMLKSDPAKIDRPPKTILSNLRNVTFSGTSEQNYAKLKVLVLWNSGSERVNSLEASGGLSNS